LIAKCICYSYFGNGVGNGAISIAQLGFIDDYYKVNTNDYCNGFAQTVGQIVVFKNGVIDIQALGYTLSVKPKHFFKF
jgi:hypothetical protein